MSASCCPAAARGARPDPEPDLVSRSAAVVLPPLVLLAAWLGWAGYDPDRGFSDTWLLPAVVPVTLARAWRGRRPRYGALAGTGAAVAAGVGLIGLLLGRDAAEVARVGVGTVLVASLLLLGYGRRRAGPSWFPSRPAEVPLFVALGVLASLALVALGSVPGGGLGGTGDLAQDARWVVRAALGLIGGGLTGFALWYGAPSQAGVRYRAALPLLAPVGAACMAVPYAAPEYPLAWLLCVPAVWIGLALSTRWAAVAVTLAVACALLAGRVARHPAAPPQWDLQPEIVLTVMTALCFLIVVHRQHTAGLTAKAGERYRQEAAQHALLTSVIAAMTDAVLITDAAGRIVLANAAARTLLGRPAVPTGPAGPAAGWATTYGLRAADGGPLDDAALQRLQTPLPNAVTRLVVRVPMDGGHDRLCTALARGLVHASERLTLVLLSDATALHRRRRELEAFAGAVAHDLKSPLAALSLWMDVAGAEFEDDPAAGAEALRRARFSGLRMRDLIDDYLAYTVSRQGVLHPTEIRLAELAEDVAAQHRLGDPPPVIEVHTDVCVQADPLLVRQLLGNLIGNAVKYARPGTPARIVVRATAADAPGWARILVSDNGIGVAEADLAAIFQPFTRTESGVATSHGTGLCRLPA